NKAYRGINTIILWVSAAARGYTSGRWITYKQAQSIGAQVRKGEKGTHIAVYKPWELRETNSSGQEETRLVPVLRTYTVFAVEQCDGIELPAAPETIEPIATRHAAADAIMAQAKVNHGGDRAFYSPSIDQITLPVQAAFVDSCSYYATALHELTHWTGHKSRCARDFQNRFGTQGYAREELVAELGAAYLCAHLNIEGKLQHAEYLASWLEVLKSDKKAIFTAASAAQKAVDYALRAENETEEEGDEAIAAYKRKSPGCWCETAGAGHPLKRGYTMSSTFYSDGYRDGEAGHDASPPDPLTRADGKTTDVFASEYMEGWNAGYSARQNNGLPNPDQLVAIQAFARKYGRTWKHALLNAWLNGDDAREPCGHYLRQIRNQFGPTWLIKFKLEN
ncbi:MAG: zincin-like metallopeptidase domain-containing protein, partial [Proteobacteria bacterium]|nr:zincin-like metallopeptidase domain-containing protein [Pseudomonadota bacterium]